jgi:hypothetical protein
MRQGQVNGGGRFAQGKARARHVPRTVPILRLLGAGPLYFLRVRAVSCVGEVGREYSLLQLNP